MATREELYKRFGPQLVDAVVQVTLDEINIIRSELGLPLRTGDQVINAISNKLDGIPIYDWQQEHLSGG